MNKIVRLLRYDWPLHFVLVLTNWWPDNVFLIRLRGRLARPFFRSCGKNLLLGRDITFYNSSNISFGENVYVAKGCWFSGGEKISVGNDILFGPYVVIVTSNHSIYKESYFFGEPVDLKPVVIKSGSWIGAHCTILSGSELNRCCLLAANSVFKGKSEEFGVYAGQPAKFIRTSN